MTQCLYDRKISLKAKALFLMIDSFGGEITAEEISKYCDDGSTSINSGLKELEERGYLARELVRVKGRIVGVTYNLNPNPQV